MLHLLSACLFSRELAEVELAHAGDAFGPFWDQIFGLASASVIVCVAAVESYSNELFSDAEAEGRANQAPHVLKLLEDHDMDRILDKFDVILDLRGAGKLDRGRRPTQDVEDLIALRRALVHFRPEWSDERVKHDALSDRLSRRFARSPFLPNDPLFPLSWASHGCTSWAIGAAIAFIEAFQTQAGLKPTLGQFRARLSS